MGAVEDFFWTLALLVDLMTKVLRHVVFYKLHTHTHTYIYIYINISSAEGNSTKYDILSILLF